MANRRFGGGMGGGGGGDHMQRGGGFGGGGGRNFGGGGGAGGVQQSSNVNPWQGGVAPGNTQNSLQAAQLALALTNLIQQSHPGGGGGGVMGQDGRPPSLLSMNAPSPAGFYNNPNHHQSDNFNSMNRFGGGNQNNRGRVDFRRTDNFNKNRNVSGWRDNNRNRSNNRNRFNKGRTNDKGADKDKKNTSATDKAVKASVKAEKSETADDSNIDGDDTRDEEQGDAKRDWKSEKNPGDTEDDNADEDKKDDATGEKRSKDGKPKQPSKFDGLPNSFLHCFVCNKSMWDGESFQNHIRGKAHKQMINSLADSFQITVDILRENMRMAEGRRVIEMERQQRHRRFHQNNNEVPSHCNMCNHKFLGKIVVHRQSEGHQRLKRFLHPNCDACNAEFASRMEWVDHLFTSEHLTAAKKAIEEKNLEPSEYKVEEIEYDVQPLLDETMQNEDESPVLELTDDLFNLHNRIPSYKVNRAVAKNSVKAVSGFICEVCNIFTATEDDSQKHLMSESHYHRFVEEVKNKYIRETEEKKKEEAAAAAAAAAVESPTKKRKHEEDGVEDEEGTEVVESEVKEDEEEEPVAQGESTLNDSEVQNEIDAADEEMPMEEYSLKEDELLNDSNVDSANNGEAEAVEEKVEPAPVVVKPAVEKPAPKPAPEVPATPVKAAETPTPVKPAIVNKPAEASTPAKATPIPQSFQKQPQQQQQQQQQPPSVNKARRGGGMMAGNMMRNGGGGPRGKRGRK